MDIDDVCTAIAAAITTAALTVNDQRVTASPFAPDALMPPHFYTAEFIGDYDKTFGNPLTELTLTCRLMLTSADDRAGQQQAKILASTGTGTLHQTFRDMRGAPGQSALSGACDDLHLKRVAGPRLFTIGEAAFYGLEFTVFVMG